MKNKFLKFSLRRHGVKREKEKKTFFYIFYVFFLVLRSQRNNGIKDKWIENFPTSDFPRLFSGFSGNRRSKKNVVFFVETFRCLFFFLYL